MLIAALFACAFNLLAGQGGMLSFGHAAYFGVGTFATIHAMNALGGAGLLPTPLMPLAGGVAGLLFGLVAGWFATMRAGVYFSMITLALAELLHALAPHLKGVFGGEAGLSAMRMPAWGFTFGSDVEVYFLYQRRRRSSSTRYSLRSMMPAARKPSSCFFQCSCAFSAPT